MAEMSSSLAAMSAMDAPMSYSLGAMGPLLRKLDSLLRPDYRLPKLLKGRIELLKEDLEEISAPLLERSTVDSPNEMAKFWMNEVRELSYNIEDFVDSMMSKHADAKMRSVKSYKVGRVKIAWLPRPCTRATKVTELRALVRESIERHDTYLDDGCISSSRSVFTGHARVPVLYPESAYNLVGVDDSKLKLIRLLTDEEEQQLKVVAVVGPAGVGKTTLAKQVYHELGEQFECRAFVRASRKPDMRRLLGGILSQVQGCRRPFDSCTVQNLIDNLTEHLQDKRYVIVIDDLWETTAWDIVTSAFPEGNNHSRIITTAEIEGVALECCHYQSNNIFEMKPLGREDSTGLLFSLFFGPGRLCPEKLKSVVDIIITKCAGLPLATICVAGLLTSQPGNTELCQHVQECLSSNLSANSTLDETLQEVLKLSYNSLPHYLKTCLMHLCMYPEGYTMWKADLVKQWIAEGYICATEGTEIGEVADSYFGELVNRGMIQPVDINYNAEVLSCTLRNVVLDLITHESSEENFINTLDYSQTVIGLHSKARRLSLHFSNTRYAMEPTRPTLSKVRSIGFFGILECVPSVVEFKLLRVLILEFWGDHRGSMSFNLTRICRLVQLRYLKISCDASVVVELPTQVRMLRYLETLIIDAVVSAVPLDIIYLPGLWHLSLGNKIDLPDEIGRIRSLRTLRYFDVRCNSEDNILSLGDLMNLQDLHLTYFKESDEHPTEESDEHLKRNLRALASTLTKLVNLKSVTLAPGVSATTIYLDVRSSMPSPPICLQRLELLPPICIFFRLPEWIGQLQKLCILKVVVSELLMKDMDMLIRLPALTILSLYVRQPTTERFIFKRGAFLGLKYFKYTCGVLPLTFQEGAFPNLQRLELNFNAHRGAQYFHFLFGIDHLLNLKKIVGTIGAAAGAEEPDRRAAESAFKDAIRKHSRFPCYDNVKRVDRVCEEYQLRTQEKDSSSEKHEILQKKRRRKEGDSSDDQFRILLKETEEDTKQHFDRVSHFRSTMSFDQMKTGFVIQKLHHEMKTRWLKPREVLNLLQNHHLFTVEHKTQQKPPSGSWFLFNRRVHRFFKNDGYGWRKRKSGMTTAEAHEYLKVDNVKALSCYYAQDGNNPTFRRRIYWMLEPAYEHIVLVHYRDVLEGSISVSGPNNSSTPSYGASRADTHGSSVLTNNHGSSGYVEEVSSQNLTINNETNNTSRFDWTRNIEMQLSLGKKEDNDVDSEEILPNHDPVFVSGIQNEDSDNHYEGSHPYTHATDIPKKSDAWLEEDQLESILHPVPLIVNQNQWFSIHEVSPEWAFCSESAKVVIVGDFLCNPCHSSWVLFGDVKVPAEIVQQGVIRCYTPCLRAGKVKMCVLDENEKLCTEAREFEFVENPSLPRTMINGKPCSEAREFEFQQNPTKSGDELLLLNYVQMLFDGQFCELFSKFGLPLPNVQSGSQTNPSEIIRGSCEQLDHEDAVNCIMEVMLNNRFQDWLTSKFEQNSEGKYLLPKQYHGVIHTIAALGYDSALKMLLSSGVPINYRDANGWTALHWASRFGRKKMVGALLAAGAAAGAVSHPTAEDPAAKTPASIAFAYGFKGLSAFLSEAELTNTLHSLESRQNRNPVDHAGAVGIASAVDRMSDKCAHVDGGTDDQLALKDSLGAVRNAVQAAGRIQATFRVFSLKKKKEKALQNGDNCTLSVREAGVPSRGMLEKAALSVQKNFRCWKKRKEYLRIQRNIIKIQARVRAHQERNKYKELLQSVGILEKVMLRWFRKGVGLRGFNPRSMPIDQDEDEDIVRVFRKERVETAVDEAVSRVSAIVGCPIARLEYRRMLEIHQQAKSMAMEGRTSTNS